MEKLIQIIVKRILVVQGIIVYWIYADNTVSLAPWCHALQLIVDTSYAKWLICSTNVDPSNCKTKCKFFPYSLASDILYVYLILLNGLNLPYVSNGKRLGNIPHYQIKNNDICIKRVIPIDNIKGILQEFYFAHRSIKWMLM